MNTPLKKSLFILSLCAVTVSLFALSTERRESHLAVEAVKGLQADSVDEPLEGGEATPTASGFYLASRAAQHRSEWGDAARFLEQALPLSAAKRAKLAAQDATAAADAEASTDETATESTATNTAKPSSAAAKNATIYDDDLDLQLRMMLFQLGTGEFEKAFTLAQTLQDTLRVDAPQSTSPLLSAPDLAEDASTTVILHPVAPSDMGGTESRRDETSINDRLSFATAALVIKAFKDGDMTQARTYIDRMGRGALSAGLKPSFELWQKSGSIEKLTAKDLNVSNDGILIMLHKAYALEAAGNIKEARQMLAQAHSRAGTVGTAVAMAMFELRVRNVDKAKAVFNDLLKQSPDDTELKDILQSLDAIKTPEDIPHAVKGYKNFEIHLKGPEHGLALALYDLAGMHLAEGSQEAALILAQFSHYLAPDIEQTAFLLSDILTAQKNYPKALDALATIPHDSDLSVEALVKRADLLDKLDKRDEAIALLFGALETNKNAQLAYTLGDLYRGEEDYQKALDAYNKVAEYSDGVVPDALWSTHYFKGIAYHKLEQWDEAEKELLIALDLRPQNPFVLNYLGYSWADMNKNVEQALQMLEEALQIQPDSGFITDSLGWAYYKLGDYELATLYLERAAELLPYDPEINDHLGDVYWKTGRKLEARYQWQRAVDYGKPKDSAEIIKQAKKKLESGL